MCIRDSLRLLLDELIDRFGDPPPPVMNLLSVARIKNYARDLGVRSVIEKPRFIEIVFSEHPRVEVEHMLRLKERLGSLLKILPGPPETLRLALAPQHEKKALNYLTRCMMTLAGRENAHV